MTAFEDLQVWQSGLGLMKEVYGVSRSFPKEEQFALTSQIRRASTSILANLAEGCSRFTYPDKAAKFVISRSECGEVKAFALMAVSLGFISQEKIVGLLASQDEVSRMLSGLIESCRSRSARKPLVHS